MIISGDSEMLGPWSRARVSVRCSVRGMGGIGLCFDLGSGTDVTVKGRMSFRFAVRCGYCLW